MGRTRGFGGLLTAAMVLLAGCLVVLTGPAPAAHACSCVPVTRQEAAQRADVIMFGRVETVRPVSDPESGQELTLSVRFVYKGTAYAEQLVQTPDSSAGCGISVEPGTTVLIFAKERAQPRTEHAYELVTTLCDGNAVTRNPPRNVGRPYPPLPGSSADVGAAERTDEAIGRGLLTLALVGLGIVIIGGAALAWLWRPNRTG